MSEAKLSDEQLRHDLRPLFEGMRAPVTLKKVRKRLQAQKQNVRLQRLITMHGLEKLSSLTLRLMQEGPLQPEANSQEQAASASEGVPLAIPPVPSSVPSSTTPDSTKSGMLVSDTIPCSDLNGETWKNLLNADKVIPLITPVYLPYSLQHTLLVGVQQMLEDSLFKYGSDKMRDVVKTKGWDCSQCVELNDWVKILRKRKDLVPSPKGKTPNRPLSAVLSSVVQLRHTAVHRQKVTALEVQSFLEDAEFLLNFLDDGASAEEISDIRQSLSDHVEDLSAHSNSYQERLRVITKDKQMQMFQLQLEEHLAVGQVLAESQEYERRATVQFQQRTLRKEFAHARTGSAATLARGDKCDHHVEEETFRFCANCIEDVRTGVRADVEKSFASRKNTIWLSKMVSFTDTTRTRDLLLTRASWRTMVLALLVSLMSFGTLLWIKGIEAGYPTA